MCGIIKIRTKGEYSKTVKTLRKKYHKQSKRGTDGFGFISVEGDKIKSFKRSQTEKEIMAELSNEKTANDIIFHHRFPTSTANVAEASHPIKVENEELKNIFYVVHNGVITNADSLKSRHEKLGYQYTTELEYLIKTNDRQYFERSEFNDSEGLAVELARYLSGKSLEIDTTGSVAFIVLETNKSGKTLKYHYGRNEGNPLTITDTERIEILASEGGTLLPANTLFTYDYKTKITTQEACKVGFYWDYSDNKYDDDYKVKDACGNKHDSFNWGTGKDEDDAEAWDYKEQQMADELEELKIEMQYYLEAT